MKIIFFILICYSSNNLAYVISKSDTGKDIRWRLFDSKIKVSYDSSAGQEDNFILDVSEQQLADFNISKREYIKQRAKEIFLNSIQQWNSVGAIQIVSQEDSSLPALGSGENTIRFSSDRRFFGPGVIGVTTIGFASDGGEIVSADILINEDNISTTLSLDPAVSSNQEAYVGDILTHEIGHLYGLSHSQVVGASMVFSIFKGQHTLSFDDINGFKDNYSYLDQDLASIKGDVVAGFDLQKIFGVSVDLFSITENKVVQNQLTDESGRFYFKNVDPNQFYLLRVSPVKNKATIPAYYEKSNTFLCGTNNFKEAFFTTCSSRSKSRAQTISVSPKEDLDIGKITIKCDENLDTKYLNNKFIEDEPTPIELLIKPNLPNHFYGLFSRQEISQGILGKGDFFKVDLSYLNDFSNMKKVKISLASTGLGSNYDLFAAIKRGELDGPYESFQSREDQNGKLNTDRSIMLDLSGDPLENIFYIKLFPIKIDEDKEYEIFSSLSSNSLNLSNKNNLYLISVDLGETEGSEFKSVFTGESSQLEDNYLCPEGNVSYTGKPFLEQSSVDNASRSGGSDESVGASCATIDLDNNNPSGPGSFLCGLFFFALLLLSRNLNHNTLSKS